MISDPVIGVVEILVIRAENLPKMDLLGKCDPYIEATFGRNWRNKTTVKHRTLDPEYNEMMKCAVKTSEARYSFQFDLWDWDKVSKNDKFGRVVVDVGTLVDNKPHEQWYEIENVDKPGKPAGRLLLNLHMKNLMTVEKDFWTDLSNHFDADHNGRISYLEFSTMVNGIHPKALEADVQQLGLELGLDKREINIPEFVQCMSTSHESMKKYPAINKIITPEVKDLIFHVAAGTQLLTIGLGAQGDPQDRMGTGEKPVDVKKIMVQNRATGRLEEEKIPHYISISLHMMYQLKQGRFAVNNSKVASLLKHLSVEQGKKYNSPDSKKEIQNFIQFHNLNREEIKDPLDSFQNFNEFFYRKLKDGERPIKDPKNNNIAVSPADCRLNVFSTIDEATRLWIKGKNFTVQSLVNDDALASKYNGGTLVIARLAPQDYHRFHIPVDGVLGDFVPIEGRYYTVNPMAVNAEFDVYTENKRTYVTIKSEQFGDVLYVAIGATMVGSINFTQKVGAKVKRGDELGYFAFGGSTVLVFFQRGTITLDNDLVVNSSKPLETLIKMGDSIGVATK